MLPLAGQLVFVTREMTFPAVLLAPYPTLWGNGVDGVEEALCASSSSSCTLKSNLEATQLVRRSLLNSIQVRRYFGQLERLGGKALGVGDGVESRNDAL